jgi:hypothetical protein
MDGGARSHDGHQRGSICHQERSTILPTKLVYKWLYLVGGIPSTPLTNMSQWEGFSLFYEMEKSNKCLKPRINYINTISSISLGFMVDWSRYSLTLHRKTPFRSPQNTVPLPGHTGSCWGSLIWPQGGRSLGGPVVWRGVIFMLIPDNPRTYSQEIAINNAKYTI